MALTVAGLAELWLFANPLSAMVALVTMLSYVVWYTPLKLRSSLSTIVGAVPGALPPLIGWAAATNTLSLPGWALFAIVFLWQMPHFLAIAWMHRDDYARAGMPLLPVIEPDGRSTGRQAVLYAAAMIPVSLLPTVVGLAGPRYLAAALVLGAIVLWLAFEFAATRSHASARRLFFATIIYLPLLWLVLVLDHAARGPRIGQGYSRYFARRRRQPASAAAQPAAIAAGSSPAGPARNRIVSRAAARRSSCRTASPCSRHSAAAISRPTRTGCSASRLVTTMYTPWQATFACTLDAGVNGTG